MNVPRETVRLWVSEAAALGDEDSYCAKRGAKRYSCYWEVDMRIGHAVHRVTVRDISEQGVGIISSVEVGPGRSIELRRTPDEPWIRSRVMHSTRTVGRYKLGAIIQFEDDIPRQRGPEETKLLGESLLVLAKLKMSRGDAPAAEMLIRECVDIRMKNLPPNHWVTAAARSVLGECMIVLGRHAGAEPLLLESYTDIKAGLGDDNERTRAALARIVNLYEAWGKPELADEYRAAAR